MWGRQNELNVKSHSIPKPLQRRSERGYILITLILFVALIAEKSATL